MTAVVVLHDLGAGAAGEPWRAAAPPDWHIPDLPGHGSTPAPRHGAYDPLGPVTLARWALGGRGLVVGVGQNAHSALILGAGGACDAVAIVDGLWGPWESAESAVDAMYDGLRRLLEDDGATAPAPPAGLDPRAAHGYGVTMSAEFARRFWGSVTCPVLAVETPASPTPAGERADRAAWFGGDATLVEVEDNDPGALTAVISSWSGR